MRKRIRPCIFVEAGYRKRDDFAGALDRDGCLKRSKSDCQIRGRWANARVSAKERMVLVLALARVTGGATFFKTTHVAMAIIPATRVLREITAKGGDVANLRGSDFGRGFGQSGECLPHFRVRGKFGDSDVRADAPRLRARFDRARIRKRLDVDQPFRLEQVIL